MRKWKLVLVLTMAVSTIGFSQSVSYKEIDNDPSQLPNLQLKIYPAFVGISSGAEKEGIEEDAVVPVGWQIDLNFRPIPVLDDRLGFNLKYMKSYLEIPNKLDENGEKIRYKQFEVGGTFRIFQKTKEVEESLRLGSSSDGRTTTTTFISKVPMDNSIEMDLAGGIYHISTPIDIGPVTSTVKAFGLYGGFRFTGKVNYRAKVSGYGVKKYSARNSFYVNVLYTPSVSYTNETQTSYGSTLSGPAFETQNVVDSVGLNSNFGIVLGYELEWAPISPVSFSMPFEIGKKPPFNGIYMYIGMAMSINLNIGKD